MKTETSIFLLTAAIGLGFASAPAVAVPETVTNRAVAPARCQAFTPGPSNTIRNRVAGAENIGAELALACSFEHVSTTLDGQPNSQVQVQLYNNGTASITVSCTNLQGDFESVGTTITKSATIAPSASATLSFSAADTPSTTDTNLGSKFSGVNCTMPTNAVMTATEVSWIDDFA